MATQIWTRLSVRNNTTPLPSLTAVGIALELNLTMAIAPCSHGGGVRGWGVGGGDAVCRCGVRVRAGNGGSEWTFVGLDLHSDTVVVDRSHSSSARVSHQTAAMPGETLGPSRAYTLRIFVDHSVVTVFSESGKVLTTRVYPSPQSTGVMLESTGTNCVFDLSAWGLSRPHST